MSLFSSVPSQYFSVLSGSSKDTHAKLLLLVYEQYRKSIYTIDRDVIIDLFVENLESSNEDIIISEQEISIQDNRDRAFYFLRKFIETGWLIQEKDYDHTFKISLPDYSLRIFEAFKKIIDGYQMEFRGHVLAIYQNLTGEEGKTYIALHQAYELTLQLIDGLKSLNHNIKRYTERLLKSEKIEDMLRQIFDEYEVEVLGAQYYRLKSSDHVSKYRTKIMEIIRSWQYNNTLVTEQARIMFQEKQVNFQDEGENLINEWLSFIENSFDQMDEILQEIDRRNQQYASAATQQVRLQLLQSESLEGKLNEVLISKCVV